MDDNILKPTSDAADSVIAKIKKAIRLARGTKEEGERETALRLARQLAERNGLAFEEIDEGLEVARAVQINDDAEERIEGPEIGYSFSIIHDHFGVVAMITQTSRWDAAHGRYTWFGPRINIDIARHVHHILLRESRAAFRRARKVAPRIKRLAFMQGFFAAIYIKLTEHPLRNDREAFAAEKKAAERKFEEFRTKHSVRESRKPRSPDDPNAISMGYHDGKKVNLARPCENSATERFALKSNI